MDNLKTCSKCKEEKDRGEFQRKSAAKDRLSPSCKTCLREHDRQRYLNNKEKRLEYDRKYRSKNKKKIAQRKQEYYLNNKEKAKQWRLNNKDKINEYSQNYRLKNLEKTATRLRKYQIENKEKMSAIAAKRRARKLQATPNCLSENDLKWIEWYYKQAKLLEQLTGIPHHVDHIHPLSKGGLHVPWNLQVLTAEENIKKHAKITA